MYSPQVGSSVAFYTLHFEPQSGGGLKRFSVRTFFRCRKNIHPKLCQIAQKSARPDGARPPQHSCRSSQGRLSSGTTRPAVFVAFSIEFRTENFRIFSGPQKFSSEIVCPRPIAKKIGLVSSLGPGPQYLIQMAETGRSCISSRSLPAILAQPPEVTRTSGTLQGFHMAAAFCPGQGHTARTVHGGDRSMAP